MNTIFRFNSNPTKTEPKTTLRFMVITSSFWRSHKCTNLVDILQLMSILSIAFRVKDLMMFGEQLINLFSKLKPRLWFEWKSIAWLVICTENVINRELWFFYETSHCHLLCRSGFHSSRISKYDKDNIPSGTRSQISPFRVRIGSISIPDPFVIFQKNNETFFSQ